VKIFFLGSVTLVSPLGFDDIKVRLKPHIQRISTSQHVKIFFLGSVTLASPLGFDDIKVRLKPHIQKSKKLGMWKHLGMRGRK